MMGEVTDPAMKKLFDIPEELYKDSMFLRDIKINYLRYGKLSERQIDVFKEVVEKVKNSLKKKEEKTKKMLDESKSSS
jgi:predicted DNA-binding WGR domain protein